MNRLILFLSFVFCFLVQLYSQPYKDSRLPVDIRVDDLLGRMTLEEKIAQIRHIHSWDIFNDQELDEEKLQKLAGDVAWGFVEGFPLIGENCRLHMRRIQEYMVNKTRLGIPVFTIAEALHGSVHEGSTIYPQNIALGATFNPSLAYDKASKISEDLHYQGIRQILAPCVDVVRDLRWGRVEESYGEDPFLNAMFACQEVKGYLDNGISPMLKHFGPHGNPSGGLNLASVNCGIGELHDIYLQPFRKVITSFPIQAVMSSYNAWNRFPVSSSHYLLTEVLREHWGFEGYVYADWGAIDMLHTFHRTAVNSAEAAFLAVSAGLDVEAASQCYAWLPEILQRGMVKQAIIDKAVRRVLMAKFKMGLFEDPYGERWAHAQMHSDASVALSRKIADESVVLLKNEGGLLPLDLSKISSIAVIGPNAQSVQFGDYSWSRSTEDGISPLEGILAYTLNRGIQVNYALGCDLMSNDESGIVEAQQVARKSDVAVVFCGSSSASLARDYKGANCGEGFDLSDLSLTGAQEKLIQAVYATGTPVILVLVTGKPFAISWEKLHLPSILVQWYAGEQEGASIADILFGKVNPSGRLPVSFPQSAGHLPVFYNYLPSDKGFYHQPGTLDKPGRDYVFSSPDVLWAFGYGLSYTQFEYSSPEILLRNDSVYAFVTIKNVGERTGMDVPQLYVRDVVSSIETPVRQLKAFQKIELSSKDSMRIVLAFPLEELALTDENGNSRIEPGEFEIQIGKSSDYILFKEVIQVGDRGRWNWGELSRQVKKVQSCLGKNMKIGGVVRDIQATPVEGVEILSESKGNFLGYTDTNGRYLIHAQQGECLLFRKKGYLQEKAKVTDEEFMPIVLRNDKFDK